MTSSPSFRLRALALIAVLALALAACRTAQPAATVDGAKITDDQLAQDAGAFRFLQILTRRSCGTAGKGESTDAACARFTLGYLIQVDVLKEYATAHDLSVPDKNITDTLSQLKASVGEQVFSSTLKAEKVSEADVHALLSRLLLFGSVQDAVAKERVTDQQITQAYEQDPLKYTGLHAAHILVASQKLAEKISKEATSKNFAKLAKKYSSDTGSAQNGGDLGAVPASNFLPEFSHAALALKPGEISEPVQTQYGWHVIMLIDARKIPLDQARDQIVKDLSHQAFVAWFQKSLENADISVNPKYGAFDTKNGSVVAIRSTATGSPSAPST